MLNQEIVADKPNEMQAEDNHKIKTFSNFDEYACRIDDQTNAGKNNEKDNGKDNSCVYLKIEVILPFNDMTSRKKLLIFLNSINSNEHCPLICSLQDERNQK